MFSLEQLKGIADSRVKALVEGGTLDNAKPIYCHPIECKIVSGTRTYYFSCLIFNNDNTAFTWSTFFAYISDLINNYDAKIMCSGSFFDTNSYMINCCIKKSASDTIALHGIDNVGNINYYSLADTMTPEIFVDGINKIN